MLAYLAGIGLDVHVPCMYRMQNVLLAGRYAQGGGIGVAIEQQRRHDIAMPAACIESLGEILLLKETAGPGGTGCKAVKCMVITVV